MATNTKLQPSPKEINDRLRLQYKIVRFIEDVLGEQIGYDLEIIVNTGIVLRCFQKIYPDENITINTLEKEIAYVDNINTLNRICKEHFKIPEQDFISPVQKDARPFLHAVFQKQILSVLSRAFKLLDSTTDHHFVGEDQYPTFTTEQRTAARDQLLLINNGDIDLTDEPPLPEDDSVKQRKAEEKKTEEPKTSAPSSAASPSGANSLLNCRNIAIAIAALIVLYLIIR